MSLNYGLSIVKISALVTGNQNIKKYQSGPLLEAIRCDRQLWWAGHTQRT